MKGNQMEQMVDGFNLVFLKLDQTVTEIGRDQLDDVQQVLDDINALDDFLTDDEVPNIQLLTTS